MIAAVNWIDIFFLVIICFYAYEGFAVGFVWSFTDLLSFVASFFVGFVSYAFIGKLLASIFGIPQGFSYATGFFLAAFVFEVISNVLLRFFVREYLLDERNQTDPSSFSTPGHVLGVVPGILSAVILIAFFATVVVALPFAPGVKRVVSESIIGGFLVGRTQGIEKQMHAVFGKAASETINFVTVEPQSNELVHLGFQTTDVMEDNAAEQEMFLLVNQERAKVGMAKLTFNTALRDVGRAHTKDMFARGYFSHYTPEGASPFDRMEHAHIVYTHAGENLALSPDVHLAMQGLMQSPGHRANILSPDFSTVGIGVIDGGIYGLMFAQEFSD